MNKSLSGCVRHMMDWSFVYDGTADAPDPQDYEREQVGNKKLNKYTVFVLLL